MCYCPTPTLHLNLALTGDGAFIFSLKKTHSVWFISVLNYGDTENVLINHLLLVIPMSYPCHYTNLCPHKPHKHAHTHTHTHTLANIHRVEQCLCMHVFIHIMTWCFETHISVHDTSILNCESANPPILSVWQIWGFQRLISKLQPPTPNKSKLNPEAQHYF